MLLLESCATTEMLSALAAVASAIFSFLSIRIARDALRSSEQALAEQREANETASKDAALAQFEGQFYKMLELHRSNVDGLELVNLANKMVKGRNVFEEAKNDLYRALQDTTLVFTPLYDVFNPAPPRLIEMDKNQELKNLKTFALKFQFAYQLFYWNEATSNLYLDFGQNRYSLAIPGSPRNSNSHWYAVFNVYFRHLFMMVRFVDESKVVSTRDDKMRYLKLIRAQLSNTEQLLLFYNWLIGYGAAWENRENRFLTEYKMIHNLFPEDLYPHRYFSDAINGLINQYNEHYGVGKLFEFQGNNPETVLQDMPL